MTARPKYSIGTRIRLLPQLAAETAALGEFAIVSRHFLNTKDPRYRIRNLLDRHEQTVSEDAIVMSVHGVGSKIVPFRAPRPSLGRE